jgi:hypothetical protein
VDPGVEGMVKVLDRCSVAARFDVVNGLSVVGSGARALRATAEYESSEKECNCLLDSSISRPECFLDEERQS